MSAIWEIGLEPIDGVARRVAQDRDFDTATERDLEVLIVSLMDRQGGLRIELVRIEGELEESRIRYRTYGTESPPGWFAGRKLEKERLGIESRKIGNAIDCLRRRLGARRVRGLAEAFLAAARETLPADVYHDLFRRAETASTVAAKTYGPVTE